MRLYELFTNTLIESLEYMEDYQEQYCIDVLYDYDYEQLRDAIINHWNHIKWLNNTQPTQTYIHCKYYYYAQRDLIRLSNIFKR